MEALGLSPTPAAEPPSNPGFQLLREFSWGQHGDYHWGAVVRNTTGSPVGFEAAITFKGIQGEEVGHGEARILACAPGCDALILCDTATPFLSAECDIALTPAQGPAPQDAVTVSLERSHGNVLLTAVNRSSLTFGTVEFSCLFLDAAGNVVDSTWGYFSDLDGVLNPGESVSREETCAADFEAVLVFLGGSGK